MRTKTVNMLSGSVTKGLLSMTIPIMVMNVTQVLFNAIDMMMLKNHGTAVGAVGVCGTLTTLFTNFLIGISVGANVVVAKRIGASEQERANQAASTSMIIALAGGILLLAIGVPFAQTFLKLTNCPAELLQQATVYFKLYFYGVPALMIYNFTAAILRSIGDTRRPMVFLVFGGAIKVLCTYIFVNYCNLTVRGVGYATIISNVVTCAPAVFVLIKRQNIVRFKLTCLRFTFQEFKDILYIGVPAGIQSSLFALANVVITTTVNGMGSDASTGVSIANQFDSILYQMCYAPSLAVTPYVAQNFGAKQIQRIKETLLKAALITLVIGAGFGTLSAVFSRQLSGLMSDIPAVLDYSQQKMIIVSSTYFICGINEVIGGALKGLGRPFMPTITSFLFMCVLRFVWVYAIFPFFPNLSFLYAVWPIGWALSIVVLLIDFCIAFSRIKAAMSNPIRTNRSL